MNKYILCVIAVFSLSFENDLYCKSKNKQEIKRELPPQIRENPIWWCSICEEELACDLKFCPGCWFPQVFAYHEDQYGRPYTTLNGVEESELSWKEIKERRNFSIG